MKVYGNLWNFSESQRKGGKREPKGAKGNQKGSKRWQKWAKREPAVAKSELRGGPRVPKVSHRATKMHQKNCLPERSRKGSKKAYRIKKKWEPFKKLKKLKPIQQIIPKTIIQKHKHWCQRGAKMEPKSMPTRIKIQCQNRHRKRLGISSNIMFLWRVKSFKFLLKTMALKV